GVLRREAEERSVPIVFSSHQLELVERLCDRVVLIDHGRIVAAGTIDELRSARERRLLSVTVSGADDGWVEGIPRLRLVDGYGDGAMILELADGVDEQRVLDVARSAGDVTGFVRVRPTLAELFREAVGA